MNSSYGTRQTIETSDFGSRTLPKPHPSTDRPVERYAPERSRRTEYLLPTSRGDGCEQTLAKRAWSFHRHFDISSIF
jgi:hypothetical protein